VGMSFKNLAINRNLIKSTLEGYSAQATVIGPESTGKFDKYIVKMPGQPDALLHLFFIKGGAVFMISLLYLVELT
jgi:hypothetical protein